MRTVKRAAALVALLPCVIAGAAPLVTAPALAAVPGTAAQPDAERSPGQDRARAQVGLQLTKLTPKTLRDNSRIDIAGISQNRSDHQLTGLTIRLRYSTQPIGSRSQLEQLAVGPPSSLPGVGPAKPLAQAAEPGAKQNWEFTLGAKALRLPAAGGSPAVYPLGVEVLNSAQQVVGGVTTFLTSAPKRGGYKRVAIGWVWPLIDRQHRADDRVFLDDLLAQDMAAGGRLSELVGAASSTSTPVTWGIDPALLDDVQEMASHDYVVRPPGKKATENKQSTVAASWLAALKQAFKGDPYFTVPYADPDVVALVRWKMSGSVVAAYDPKNTGVVAQALGRPANTQIAWPPSGAAGPDTLNLLAKLGLGSGGSFLMSSSQFEDPPLGPSANATTTLPTHSHGTKKALVYDAKLSEIVTTGSKGGAGAALTEQRFLAETAMIAAETPSVQRTVIVAPDRHWNPAPGLAKNLLAYSKSASWLAATGLSKFESAQPRERGFKGCDDECQQYELGLPYLTQVRNIARRAASFSAIMVPPVGISYDRALLRSQSTAWRSRGPRAKRVREELARQLDSELGKVRIVTPNSKRVNLAGSSGRLPVTIQNKLRGQSVRVRLTATSANSAKLQLGQLSANDAVIELRPGENVQRWIPAKAAGNGNFSVHLQLEIPDSGRPFGDGADITVRTTGYGRLALLITGGGLAVLFVGVGVRAIRARRRRKAEAAGDGSTGMGPAAAGEPGDRFPGPGLAGPGIPEPESSGPGPWAGTGPEAPVPGAAPGRAGPGPGTPAGPAAGSGSSWAGLPEPGAELSGPGISRAGLSGTGVPGAGLSGPGLSGPGTAEPGEHPAGTAEPAAGLPEPAADGRAPGRGKHRSGNRD